MIFEFPQQLTILRVTDGPRDTDNNPTTVVVPLPTLGAFAPGGSVELTSGGDQVTTRPQVFIQDGYPAPTATDQLVVPGVGTFDVDGTPDVFVNPFTGWAPGPVVNLISVEG